MTEKLKRYRSFISYGQKDKSYARRLHRALETYRLPRGVEAQSIDAKTNLVRTALSRIGPRNATLRSVSVWLGRFKHTPTGARFAAQARRGLRLCEVR